MARKPPEEQTGEQAGEQEATAPQGGAFSDLPPTLRRRVAPTRSTRGFVESEDTKAGQDAPRVMSSRGDARESLDALNFQAVDRVSEEKLRELQFMEDVLTVHVHESTNPLDAPIPAVWNDGVSQYFIRGQEQRVKRKFVEVLARLKKTTYSQRKQVNAVGDEEYVQVPHTALLYPFSVTSDPNPNGAAWLRSVIQEG